MFDAGCWLRVVTKLKSWRTLRRFNNVSAISSATKICCVSRSRIRPSRMSRTIPCRTTSAWNFLATRCWDWFFPANFTRNFRFENLLWLALTHPSIAHEQNHPLPHNQRLEFLGDAVLGLVLSGELYEKFPDVDEGALTKSRAKLVNAGSLAAHGRMLGLGAHLHLSRGEENTGGRERPSRSEEHTSEL